MDRLGGQGRINFWPNLSIFVIRPEGWGLIETGVVMRNRQEFGVENEIGQVTWDENSLKHAQNKRYQKQRVRVSGPIRLRLRNAHQLLTTLHVLDVTNPILQLIF